MLAFDPMFNGKKGYLEPIVQASICYAWQIHPWAFAQKGFLLFLIILPASLARKYNAIKKNFHEQSL